jgi:hypothetical protein
VQSATYLSAKILHCGLKCAYQCDCYRHHGPEAVCHQRQRTAAPSADDEELDGVEASPAALTVGVHALGNLMAIVVVLRERCTPLASAVGVRCRGASRLLRGVFSRRAGVLARRAPVGILARGPGVVSRGA